MNENHTPRAGNIKIKKQITSLGTGNDQKSLEKNGVTDAGNSPIWG